MSHLTLQIIARCHIAVAVRLFPILDTNCHNIDIQFFLCRCFTWLCQVKCVSFFEKLEK